MIKGSIKNKQAGLSKSIFKFSTWINEDSFKDDPIIWAVSEEMTQSEAEDEIDRKLSDVELNRIHKCLYYDIEESSVSWNLMVMIREAIQCAIDDPKSWSEADEQFRNKLY